MPHKDDNHREIMEAALARDVERASRAVEQHVRRTVEMALKHVPGLDVLKARPGSSKGAAKKPRTVACTAPKAARAQQKLSTLSSR
jgi:hypothetical protein